MNSAKLSYADVLKSSSSFLNPGLPTRPLVAKAPRTRLSEEAKAKLRAAIHDKPTSESTELKTETVIYPEANSGKKVKVVKPKRKSRKESVPPTVTKCSQPLILAKASDWIMHGSVMSAAIYAEKKPLSSVRFLDPEELKLNQAS